VAGWRGGTGKCISAFSNKRIPYCVKFNPDADKQHQFLAGCSDKKIIQVRPLPFSFCACVCAFWVCTVAHCFVRHD
jgi:hypothetical protein